jgi:Metallo-peptidase family M12/Calx-beta domain/Domain of unknown function (DUF4214)/Reprolysin family propeptide
MPSKKNLRLVVAVIALAGFFAMLVAGRGASKAAPGHQQQIEKFLKRHDSLKLDALGAARQARETGRLLLTTSDLTFDLELAPNDLRAQNYRAEEVTEGGVVRPVAMNPPSTFKGSVRGLVGAEARFTIDDEKIEGVIITPTERYYVEPLRNYMPTAKDTDYVFYKSADVIEGAHGACATMAAKLNAEVERLASRANQPLTATSLRQVDFASEADYEYVTYFGSSAAANTEILNIMNQVDGLYQKEFGVTFRITYQHTWATSADPYSETSAAGILTEFTNYWNANITQPRDLAHIWTDKLLDGGFTAGVAWLGTLCHDPAHSYAVSMRVIDGFKYSIAAHEIGHNFGATHPDEQNPPVAACATTIMNSVVGATFDFCQFSQDQMNAYLSTNSGCLAIVSASPTVQFSAANFQVSEDAGSVTVTVTRAGDTSGAATVDYKTSDGTATARTDYLATSGTLDFAAGESSKTFSVLIVDDVYIESNETINLSLSNPIGAALGNQSTATVTIVDNDLVPATTNPLDTPAFFVRQHYLDFLNREPDSGGLNYWSTQLTQCSTDASCLNSRHTGVSAAFFVESEFQETGYYVYRIYKAAYARKPVFNEFASDRTRVIGGSDLDSSKQSLAADFVARPAFIAQYPASLAPEQYVDQLNANTGSLLTQDERNALVNGLNSGTEVRASVLRKIAENQLFKQQEYNSAFVLMQYFGYLRRDPDQGGYDFWLNVLNHQEPNNLSGMVCAFLTSAEYQLRFSPIVTRSNRECSQ